MSNNQNINFTQVKVDEITKTLSEHLFKKFKIERFLSKAGINKARGIQISLMLCIMFYISFKSKKSIHTGLIELELTKQKMLIIDYSMNLTMIGVTSCFLQQNTTPNNTQLMNQKSVV